MTDMSFKRGGGGRKGERREKTREEDKIKKETESKSL